MPTTSSTLMHSTYGTWMAAKTTMMPTGTTNMPAALSPDTRLFRVPQDLVQIFDRDLLAAGLAREVTDPETGEKQIDKVDADGRSLDVHSLRHTFATLLSKSGVVPRMAQELMRHSDTRLTMNVYTHLQLADTVDAVQTLPRVEAAQLAAAQCRIGTERQ